MKEEWELDVIGVEGEKVEGWDGVIEIEGLVKSISMEGKRKVILIGKRKEGENCRRSGEIVLMEIEKGGKWLKMIDKRRNEGGI